MKRFIIVTIALIIAVLLLRNTEAFAWIVKNLTDFLGAAFTAVTEVGDL
jgi:hypothetical protein